MLTDYRGFVFTLVYDADAKDQITKTNVMFSTTLPGIRNPEEDIISSIMQDGGIGLVTSLPDIYDKMFILPLIRECLALNHHDFFVELARKIREEEYVIFELCVDYWLSLDNHMELSEQFCNTLENIYDTRSQL